jgi:hypothetical protein
MPPIATSQNLTRLGILTILGALGTAIAQYAAHQSFADVNLEALITALGVGTTMVLAKGQQSTGGTVPATEEAALRIGVPLPTKAQPKGLVRLSLLILLALGAAWAVSMPIRAKASPLTKCLVGCEERIMRLGAPLGDTAAVVPAANLIWLAPSVGINGYSYSSRDGFWSLGATPGVGYGVRWLPSWWDKTAAFLALDLYGQLALVGGGGQTRSLAIDLLPTVTFANLLGGGCGGRWRLPTEAGQASERSLVCTIGFVTTAGLP